MASFTPSSIYIYTLDALNLTRTKPEEDDSQQLCLVTMATII